MRPVGRRTLLSAATAGLVAAAASACGGGPAKTGAPTTRGTGLRKIRYADDHRDQYGVLGLPRGEPTALVVLLHGGFWVAQYGAGLMDAIAADLRHRGYATWNVEYRRVGDGGGYPETFTDVAAAIDRTKQLPDVDGLPVITLGHSAGGHLAVWAASRTADTPGGAPVVLPDRTVSLSGVLDLVPAAEQHLGNGAVAQLMGGTPGQDQASYALADPTRLVPAHGKVVAIHADQDQIVPRTQSSAYVTADAAAEGSVDLALVPGGHFDLIDPRSDAWAKIVRHLGTVPR